MPIESSSKLKKGQPAPIGAHDFSLGVLTPVSGEAAAVEWIAWPRRRGRAPPISLLDGCSQLVDKDRTVPNDCSEAVVSGPLNGHATKP
jgi:hypothetical protein